MQEDGEKQQKQRLAGGAAGLSHELKNLLAVISQNLDHISRRLIDESAVNLQMAKELNFTHEQILSYAKRREIDTLLLKTRQIADKAMDLAFHGLNLGAFGREDFTSCRLSFLVTKAVELIACDHTMQEQLRSGSVDICWQAPSVEPQLKVIPVLIEQAIFNLLKNATEVDGERKTLLVTLDQWVDEQMGQVILKVADNGPGMDQQTLSRIFEPYYTTKGQRGGHGLGLFVCREVIEQIHGGSLTAKSQPGCGSCFTLTLPIGGRC